ncbi:MAG: YbhB/YbcL family Raf kinase inhibitor-like protein [Myxococcales bacterium]|nr:YbhB/YbcL family Raf kinase inhibitor-like protein [Myxococcales bacterium]
MEDALMKFIERCAIGAMVLVGCGSETGATSDTATAVSGSATSSAGGSSSTANASGGSGGMTTTSTSAGGDGGASTAMSGAGTGGSGTGGDSGAGGSGGGGAPTPFTLTSPGFIEGASIPAVNECTGCNAAGAQNDSPVLAWTAGPPGTLSYAIVMRDLDFQNGFVHWVLWDIPANVVSLPADVDNGGLPADVPGAKQAMGNYLGPCSCNSKNTYQWKVHAIDMASIPGLNAGASKASAASAVEAASKASASLSGES